LETGTIWTPDRSVAAMMRSHSSSDSAIGFSQMTCLPFSAAATAWAQCSGFGVPTQIASTSGD
jgi:hypothetical protein